MKAIFQVALALVIFISPAAARGDEVAFLRQSCRELVKMYSDSDTPRLLAAVMTSKSEALRAGYCQGVVREYMRANPHCNDYGQTWLGVAQRVLTRNADTMESLLRSAYCGG